MAARQDATGRMTFAEEVDAFLRAPKRLAGAPVWRQNPPQTEWRAYYEVEIDGRLSDRRLEMAAYPDQRPASFTICINWPPPILRMTVEGDVHFHDNARPPGGVSHRVIGSRCFLWEDNRTWLRPGYDGPLTARPLDPSLRAWDNALRWLCACARIEITGLTLLDYPNRLTLFGPG